VLAFLRWKTDLRLVKGPAVDILQEIESVEVADSLPKRYDVGW
jgi:hypothetical protein